MLLLLLFVLECPGGAFDKRELCRFGGGINASAPGTASSVRPTLEFGALATNDGGSGILAGELIECIVPGDPAQVHPGECLRAMESMLIPRVCVDPTSKIGFCCFCSDPRQDSISSSFMGVTPR